MSEQEQFDKGNVTVIFKDGSKLCVSGANDMFYRDDNQICVIEKNNRAILINAETIKLCGRSEDLKAYIAK